jgi:hypothetical protein
MTYPEFIASLKHIRYIDDDYYSLLVLFKNDILMDTARLNQGVIAKKLGLNPTKFSFLLILLRLDISLTKDREDSLKGLTYDNSTSSL